MDNIKIYEVNSAYINYLLPYAPHLFQNKKSGQKNERKYIGVVLEINSIQKIYLTLKQYSRSGLIKAAPFLVQGPDGDSSKFCVKSVQNL